MEVLSYINGQFKRSESGATFENVNPYDLNDSLGTWSGSDEYIEKAIRAGKDSSWAGLGHAERIEHILRLQKAFEKREKDFEDAIVREAGKARWEARIEAQALVSKVKVSIDVMLPMIEQLKKSVEIENSQELSFRPRGLCLVIGPFNFPVHLANGHIIPALLAGNTVILKPSEQTSACATLYAKAFDEAGMPVGSFQLLTGGGELGEKLVRRPEIDAVFFTGSYQVGEKITKALLETRPDLSTLAALELGGKNAVIVHSDAYIQQALGESVLSAYATAGQRCSCASRIFVHDSLMPRFKKDFLELVSRIPYGDPSNLKTFMGPLISETAVEKFMSLHSTAKKEGFEFLKESKRLKKASCLLSPSVFMSHSPESDVESQSLQEEFFGPNCILIPFKDIDQLVRLHEASPYGLVSSLFSRDLKLFEELGNKLKLGLFNWNKATVGASGRLPFGGTKKSGNNWPAGISAYFYCTQAQASLKQPKDTGFEALPDSLKTVLES